MNKIKLDKTKHSDQTKHSNQTIFLVSVKSMTLKYFSSKGKILDC
jgi:hypothetical protein